MVPDDSEAERIIREEAERNDHGRGFAGGGSSAVANISPAGPLSVSWQVLESPLDDVVLSRIWQKAANIVTSPGAVQCAPFLQNNQEVEGRTFLNCQ